MRAYLRRTAQCEFDFPSRDFMSTEHYYRRSINDELMYRTRVKPISSSPIFNAGTERFIRDWRTAHVAVVVKDSRMREKDAILGVVMLKVGVPVSIAVSRFSSLF